MVFGFLRHKEKEIQKPSDSEDISIDTLHRDRLKTQRMELKMIQEEIKQTKLQNELVELQQDLNELRGEDEEPAQDGQSIEQMFTMEAINWFKNQQANTQTPPSGQMQQQPQQMDFLKYITLASKMPIVTLKPLVKAQTKDIDPEVVKQALDNIARCL